MHSEISLVCEDLDLVKNLGIEDGEILENVSLPIGVNFFWPDVEI